MNWTRWEVVTNAANSSSEPWQIFGNGTLIAEVHVGYAVAQQICELHNRDIAQQVCLKGAQHFCETHDAEIASTFTPRAGAPDAMRREFEAWWETQTLLLANKELTFVVWQAAWAARGKRSTFSSTKQFHETE